MELKIDKDWCARMAALESDGEIGAGFELSHILMPFASSLEEANEVLRSAYSIASREGAETNWLAFRERVGRLLAEQHKLFHFPPPTVSVSAFRQPPQGADIETQG